MNSRSITTILLLSIFFFQCKATNDDSNEKAIQDNKYLIGLLNNWYLWNDQLPDNINAGDFENTQDLLDQVRYSSLDRWSNIANAAQFTTYYDEGTYLGYGFSYGYDIEGDIRFRFTYNDGPFGRAGIQRGWKLQAVDGVNVSTITDWSNIFGPNEIGYTQTFTIEDANGTVSDYEISKGIVTINPVLFADTLAVGTETIGYLVFNNFISPAIEELDEAFDLFEQAQVDRIILDLRYNGGGQLSVATYLSNYLIPTSAEDETLFRYIHNTNQSQRDSEYSLIKTGSLNVEELIFLTTGSSASASELVLNGLKPLMNVTHIGTENTYGKPVGSYSWFSLDETTVYSLISFRFVNSNSNGDFFDGIEPDFIACDDLNTNFGVAEESLLAGALEYIQTGSTSGCNVSTKVAPTKLDLPQEGPDPTLIVNQ